MGEVTIHAVDGITFEIEKGEFAIIVGPSGAGKTTVLNMLGGMDSCSGGTITVDGPHQQLHAQAAHHLPALRHRLCLSVLQPGPEPDGPGERGAGGPDLQGPLDAADVLRHVGLGERMDNFPAQLSGGEQQRVAIARALAKNPKLLLCDEPTGALDYVTGKQILKLLQDTCRQEGMTVVVITHNTALTPMADRVIHIKNGKVAAMEQNATPRRWRRLSGEGQEKEKPPAHRRAAGGLAHQEPLSLHPGALGPGGGVPVGAAHHGPGYGVHGGQLLRRDPPDGRVCPLHPGHRGGGSGRPLRRPGIEGGGRLQRGRGGGGQHRHCPLRAGGHQPPHGGGGAPAGAPGRVRHGGTAAH